MILFCAPFYSPPDAPSPADPLARPSPLHRHRIRSLLPSKPRRTANRRSPFPSPPRQRRRRYRRRRHPDVVSFATMIPPRRRDRNSLGIDRPHSSFCVGEGWALLERDAKKRVGLGLTGGKDEKKMTNEMIHETFVKCPGRRRRHA